MKFAYEQQKIKNGFPWIIGVDEVGRGSLAGPVVSAAVIFDPAFFITRLKPSWVGMVADSKKLSEKQRTFLAQKISATCFVWSIGKISEKKIDEMNIHHASLMSMRVAVEGGMKKLFLDPHATKEKISIVVDGAFTIPGISLAQESMVRGDARIFSIAAASIVAKVYRDELMKKISKQFPNYGFEVHKGYATVRHRTAISLHGLSSLHRKSFCKNFLP